MVVKDEGGHISLTGQTGEVLKPNITDNMIPIGRGIWKVSQ